ncbi:probable G-protein coupled receptor No9 [Actinia tenebrosa]|uniref:Probable G-protein coupled receptor No9 n=1 Tax=Actinia tenebrosa TaxID=6105 RepID=A0A6P8I3B5_ACTTE|nr:probable G-protein coupled receptor No9 [Actinia tenebrosa]
MTGLSRGFNFTPTLKSTNEEGFGNSTEGEQMSPVLVHIFTTLYLFVEIIGIAGNLAILVAFFRVRKLRTKINFFLISLAFSDLTFLIAFLPLQLEWHLKKIFIHSLLVCEMMCTVYYFIISCSCLNLMAVSGYRYLTICYPFLSKRIVKNQVLYVVALIWAYSAITAMLPVLGWRSQPSSVDYQFCDFTFDRGFIFFTIGVNWFLPALAVFVFYGLIFRITRIQAKKIAKNQITLEKSERKRRNYLLKGAISLSKIVAVYLVCWLPFIIKCFLSQLDNYELIPFVYHYLIMFLTYSNSAINPFLYAGLCEDFNSAFRKIYRQFLSSMRSIGNSSGDYLRTPLNVLHQRSISSNQNNNIQLSTQVGRKTFGSRSSLYQQAATMLSSTA